MSKRTPNDGIDIASECAQLLHYHRLVRQFQTRIIHIRRTGEYPSVTPEITGDGHHVSRKKRLTPDQDRQRIDGLRVLARIIARHYLAHPELYPDPSGTEGTVPPARGDANGGRKTAR